MTFDIVVPTYKRIKKLEAFLKSLEDQDRSNVKVWIYFDNNDVEGHKHFFLHPMIDECHLLETQHRAFGVWNKHYFPNMKADAMLYVCDDIEFMPDCLKNAKELFENKFPDSDGLLGLNQANITQGEGFSRYAMGILGRKYIEHFPKGQVFCPDYISFHADAEMGRYACSVGKFVFGENCNIFHNHPGHYKDQADDTHWVVREKSQDDRETYNERNKRGFLWGKTFERVR
jgi:hypothetical protein